MSDTKSGSMPDDVTVHTIKQMTFTGDAQSKKVALVLTNTSGVTEAYAIDPRAVSALLAPLLSLAATWSDDDNFTRENIGGAANALPAKQVLFAPGRVDTECAVRVLLGRDLDLTFLLPLESVMRTYQAFSQSFRFRPKAN